MKLTLRALVLIGCLLPAARASDPAPSPEQVRFFESRIRPVLVNHCFRCHGPEKQHGGLRLDSRQAILKGGDAGPAVLPGKPGESRLIEAVRHEGLKMPPKQKLPAEEVAALTEWVRQGAPWPATAVAQGRKPGAITEEDRRWWAFQPLARTVVPNVRDASWTSTPIDRFVLARLESQRLTPVGAADRRTLIRRATFDLTGLPPTPAQIDAFLNDASPDAFAKVVDRLLASPAYGERWGRHWLDVVRYADTAGDNSDYPVPQLYLYRNWVVQAFNDDRPYDSFLREQLAGDLMPADSPRQRRERLIATGYLANSRRFGSYEDARYPWYLTIDDTIDNLGRTVLGLTLNCARCHDHKFDPVSMEDYYALYGFFQSTRYPWPGIELDKVPKDLVPLGAASEHAAALESRKKQLAALDEEIRKLEKAKSPQLAERKKERDRLQKQSLPVPLAYAVLDGTRKVGNARMHLRGDPEKPGREVPRRFLAILGGQTLPGEVSGSGRLQLANWLTDPNNPLTARVMVNRIWQHHFGRGLIPTPSDLGQQGKPPTHPQLLDWLARQFIDSGWSIKAMHRLMMLSSTYQLSSQDSEANSRIDPANENLWRWNRRRLEAEAIRDALLEMGGTLDRSPGGPHPFPDQTTWNFTQHKPFKDEYESQRRSVYLMTQRIQRHSFLGLFDGPDTNAGTARRGSSTTTLQALYLLNNPLVHEQSRRFAARLMQIAKDEDRRIVEAFLLALGRPATEEEQSQAREFLRQVRDRARASGATQPGPDELAWESFARALLLSSEFVYLD